jgi:class 3 adenylate cyclase
MHTCANCGTENREGRKFCAECGKSLAIVCPSCSAANELGERFCGECGTPLAVGAARCTSRHQGGLIVRGTDRRGGTCRGATPRICALRRPCRVHPSLGVARSGRGARVAAVSALGDEVGAPELRARAGVLTGEAAVNLAAVGEGMVAGDLVNTASRVQSVAAPGSVFVGESTRRASERAIVYEDAGSHELKGKEGETQLWRALRVVSGVGGELRSEGLEAPFVGRDRELRQIKDLFHICAEEGRAQLVSVTGIAGIGKSRLAWEFYKYFDGLSQIVYWHRGRCLAYREGVTYWALADMVRMRCRIAEDDPQEEALRKLEAALAEHLLDAEERRFVEPRLALLLGLGEHETRDRQDLFAAWRLFFERLAETYPTVLAFEDMQWADASLLDFVEYLLEWSRDKPLLVVTLARPDLLERRPTGPRAPRWAGGRTSSRQRSKPTLHGSPPAASTRCGCV